ncbi:MAG: Flp pilus assembly complex ATPase component TadA [Treponema sp.]|jgi:type IV secretion system protein VirB11|nr:Flp pilus assembly complex ATPase component TadA [Treponema sp.]
MQDITVFGQFTAEQQKKRRLMDNFLDDIEDIKKYLDDAEVTDIFIGGSGRIIYKKFGKGKIITNDYVRCSKAQGIILSLAALTGKQVDPASGLPKLECVIPHPYNARFTGMLPPWVEHPELAIRKRAAHIFSLENYVETGRMTEGQYSVVCRYIKERKNILAGGGTGSGKTTFTNAVLLKMYEYTPNDRFYIVEDVPELQSKALDATFISCKPQEASEAVRTALRWTPDRIIFGELRYGEVANELLKAWNTGHTGNITTIHADSSQSMICRIEGLLREVIPGTIPDVREVIHLCVHLRSTPQGPKISDVLETGNALSH